MSSYFPGRIGRASWLGFFLGAALLPVLLMAADRSAKAPAADPNAQAIDMFEGIRNGDLAVRFVPKDSREARVTIENKSKKPLSVKLPEAFAGVPVLAQAGGGAGGGGNRAGGGGAQGVGGGMGGGGGGGGMGMMYVAPEKVESLKVPTVCLEHGKAEPRPTVPYEIRPIDSFTAKPAVKELCRMLGTGQISQRAAQAAAWNLNNNMSWEQLAAKRMRHANGSSTPYFSMQEIRAAMQVAIVAVETAQQRQQQSGSSASEGAAAK